MSTGVPRDRNHPIEPQHVSASIDGPVPPPQYSFEDWDSFQREATRFHDLTRPDRQLVNDRIETFRSLMAPQVIQTLGSFVNVHPRYNTTEGWSGWLIAVTDELRGHDKTIKKAVTAQRWVGLYQSGDINGKALWNGLDRLVTQHELTSTEERELFWRAQSAEKQAALLALSPYFDPRDPIWDKDAQASERLMAEQLLNRIAASQQDDNPSRTQLGIQVAGVLIFLTGLLLLLGVVSVYAFRLGARVVVELQISRLTVVGVASLVTIMAGFVLAFSARPRGL